MPEAIEALREIRKLYLATGKRCRQEVDGYNDFVFLNRFSKPYEQSQLNSALRRIVRATTNRRRINRRQTGLLSQVFHAIP
jgi:hypothetical protein